MDIFYVQIAVNALCSDIRVGDFVQKYVQQARSLVDGLCVNIVILCMALPSQRVVHTHSAVGMTVHTYN